MPEALPDTPVHDFPGIQRNFDNLLKRSVPDQPAALPANPFDGQVIDYVADATNGVVWRFKYRAASASAFKWEFIGGSALYDHVETSENTASAAYVDLATVGPQITVPLAGDYEFEWGADIGSAAGTSTPLMAPNFGGTPVDALSVLVNTFAVNQGASVARCFVPPSLLAAAVVVAKYRVAAGTGSFAFRWMRAKPRRVG